MKSMCCRSSWTLFDGFNTYVCCVIWLMQCYNSPRHSYLKWFTAKSAVIDEETLIGIGITNEKLFLMESFSPGFTQSNHSNTYWIRRVCNVCLLNFGSTILTYVLWLEWMHEETGPLIIFIAWKQSKDLTWGGVSISWRVARPAETILMT